MGKLRFEITMSLDGFVAGRDQSEENGLGVGGEQLHDWVVPLAAWREPHGLEGGEVNASSAVFEESLANVGATIMGRNMFGPVRGPWPDDSWKGWWGTNPPYHVPVFVLTHHPRASITMEGGTTFHFVTDGIHAALERARDAGQGRDVRVGGGVETIRQYLRAGLVDEMHLVMAPAVLGRGEALLAGIDLPALGFERSEYVGTPNAMHLVLTKRSGQGA